MAVALALQFTSHGLKSAHEGNGTTEVVKEKVRKKRVMHYLTPKLRAKVKHLRLGHGMMPKAIQERLGLSRTQVNSALYYKPVTQTS